jgi:foldase protein PrsA
MTEEKDQNQVAEELKGEQDHSLDNQTDHRYEVVSQNEQDHDFDFDFDEVIASDDPETVVATTSNRSARVWMIASIVLLAALIYALIQPPFNNKSDSVATVNGVSISKDMLFDKMIETGGAPILDNMIVEEILKQKAEENGIKVTSTDIDDEINMFKKNFSADGEWQTVLQENNTTEDELRENIVLQLQIRKLLASQTIVTDDEISKFFDENVEAMTIDDKAPTLEEKKDEIRYTLVNQKVSELAPGFIEEARASAKIKNTLQD